MTTTRTSAQEFHDVIVLGGGAAGLAAGTALARSRRSVLVLDAGHPRNAPAAGVHNVLGHDGVPPAELLARGAAEVRSYGGTVRPGTITAAEGSLGNFTVHTADGAAHRARRLIVTTGVVDELPDLPGLADHWGRTVLHCPYCHGWEVRDAAIGVIATSALSHHQALLFRQWTADLTLFTHSGPPLTDEQRELFAARGITVETGLVTGVLDAGGSVSGVRLADGREVARTALVVAPQLVADRVLLTGLGLPVQAHPSGMGDHVPSGIGGATDVPGVRVAGTVSNPGDQVMAAAAAGLMAGAMTNMDLIEAENAAALNSYRAAGAGNEEL